MKNFQFNTTDEYIKAISQASKASDRDVLVKEYQFPVGLVRPKGFRISSAYFA